MLTLDPIPCWFLVARKITETELDNVIPSGILSRETPGPGSFRRTKFYDDIGANPGINIIATRCAERHWSLTMVLCVPTLVVQPFGSV